MRRKKNQKKVTTVEYVWAQNAISLGKKVSALFRKDAEAWLHGDVVRCYGEDSDNYGWMQAIVYSAPARRRRRRRTKNMHAVVRRAKRRSIKAEDIR